MPFSDRRTIALCDILRASIELFAADDPLEVLAHRVTLRGRQIINARICDSE